MPNPISHHNDDIARPEDVLAFWLDKLGEQGWYKQDQALDDNIREKFEPAWQHARRGGFGFWLTYPTGALAYLILTDQFPRNMFRNDVSSFATDVQARACAKSAIARGFDLRIDEPARQFFYLPLMHSENLCDQDRCIRLIVERMPQTGEHTLLHARAHRRIIRAFGRFPYRNDVMKRRHTEAEQNFITNGGYGSALNEVREVELA